MTDEDETFYSAAMKRIAELEGEIKRLNEELRSRDDYIDALRESTCQDQP